MPQRSHFAPVLRTGLRRIGGFFLVAGMVGCGGGADTAGSSGAPLSSAQQAFESVYLQANGGAHALRGKLVTLGLPGGGFQLGAGSYFYVVDTVLAQSPAMGPQTGITGRTSVAQTLAVPSNISPARYMVNGSVVAQASPAVARFSYVNGAVQQEWLSADGSQVTHTVLGTDYALVTLGGAISQSPAELFAGSDLGLLTNTVNGASFYDTGAGWQAGSGYLKVTQVAKGDQLAVEDCQAPATSGTQPTPCRTGLATLSAFFPAGFANAFGSTTYQFSDGAVVSIAGISAWVATQPEAGNASTSYRVVYLSGGNVYTGLLLRDGTPLRVFPLGSQTPQLFSAVLNLAATASVSAAVKF